MTERTKKKISELAEIARQPFTTMCLKLDCELGEDKYIVFEGLRTIETQAAYYAQGRESLENVNAKREKAGLYLLASEKDNYKITWTLESKHLRGLAMDIVPIATNGNPTWDLAHYRKQFEAIREAGRDCGLECGADWGGSMIDWPHYQVGK